MENSEVYNKPEAFKHGWTAGFYDAKFDDGRQYLEDILRFGPRVVDDNSFMAGYRAGRQARLGQSRCYPPIASRFRAAV
jgi:hypothetical protein